MPDRAAQLIAQHAETTRLLGVDFLPLGNPRAPIEPEPTASEPPEPAGSSPAPAGAPTIEAKPSRVPIESGPTEHARPVSAGFPPAATDVQSCHASLTDPREKLEAVRAKYLADAPHQHFNTEFTKVVFGEGDPQARLMFVGEAPGENEDQTGRPFVGRAGQLLDKMIVAMGLSRESVYICNVLKTRPPGNATPTAEEARLCAPYLLEQIRIVAPEVIVTLGLPATRLLLEKSEPMRVMRGHWWTFPPQGSSSGMSDPGLPEIPVMPTYHPAYLLRSYTEDNRRKVWSDLCAVRDRLGLPAGS